MLGLLSAKEISELYQERMCFDFPAAELKPLKRILKMHQEGDYQVMARRQNGEFQVYACLYSGVSPALLDYYAVHPNYRGKGLGTKVLAEILQISPYFEGMMVELESPAAASNQRDSLLRKKRIQFYRQLGFFPADVAARIFGVEYDVYYIGSNKERIADALESVYRYFVHKPDIFAQKVRIEKEKRT